MSIRDVLRQIGNRDWRGYAVISGWIVMSLLSIESGRIFISHGWLNVPIAVGPLSGYVSVFPPVFFCTAILFGLGLEWALIPAFLSSFVVNCEDGMPVGWAAMVACGDPLQLALIALAYRSTRIAYDMRSIASVCWFVGVVLLSSLAGSMGGIIWSESHSSSGADTVRNWLGWISGNFILSLLLIPVLWLGARRWAAFRTRLALDAGRPAASFLFITSSVMGAGLIVAGFLAGSNYVAATRLSITLKTGFQPETQDRIWAAVASWQIAAWSAIVLVALITVGTLILARWWSQMLNQKNAALREAVEAANVAAKAKGDFLATMSHELRTPMHGVLGLNELLLSTNLDEEQREYARLIETSARSLLHLLDAVLDFSKIEAGKLELHLAEFSLSHEIELVFQLLQPQAEAKGLALELIVAEDVPRLTFGDADRIRQILLNLVGNAIKFTEKGHVRISVSNANPEPDGAVRFVVEDTGPGIRPETLERLFVPFTQADAAMNRKHGGTGLGLSISKRLVHLMHGTIVARSTLGRGSEFSFILPLSPDVLASETSGATSDSQLTAVPTLPGNRQTAPALTRTDP